jgi:hypothetical protein
MFRDRAPLTVRFGESVLVCPAGRTARRLEALVRDLCTRCSAIVAPRPSIAPSRHVESGATITPLSRCVLWSAARPSSSRTSRRARPSVPRAAARPGLASRWRNPSCPRQPRRAASMVAMSILFIGIIASKARCASPPPAASASVSTRGVICHERPQRSLHHPH